MRRGIGVESSLSQLLHDFPSPPLFIPRWCNVERVSVSFLFDVWRCPSVRRCSIDERKMFGNGDVWNVEQTRHVERRHDNIKSVEREWLDYCSPVVIGGWRRGGRLVGWRRPLCLAGSMDRLLMRDVKVPLFSDATIFCHASAFAGSFNSSCEFFFRFVRNFRFAKKQVREEEEEEDPVRKIQG